jgi:hypothetical protein
MRGIEGVMTWLDDFDFDFPDITAVGNRWTY